jgi:hypothetical protein
MHNQRRSQRAPKSHNLIASQRYDIKTVWEKNKALDFNEIQAKIKCINQWEAKRLYNDFR